MSKMKRQTVSEELMDLLKSAGSGYYLSELKIGLEASSITKKRIEDADKSLIEAQTLYEDQKANLNPSDHRHVIWAMKSALDHHKALQVKARNPLASKPTTKEHDND